MGNSEENSGGRGPFHEAIYAFDPKTKTINSLKEEIQQCYDDGYTINLHQSSSGRTPLYFAAGHIKKLDDSIIQLLITLGAEDSPDDSGCYAISRYLDEKAQNPSAEEISRAIELFNQQQHLQCLIDQGKHTEVLHMLHIKIPRHYSFQANQPVHDFVREIVIFNQQNQQRIDSVVALLKENQNLFAYLCTGESKQDEECKHFLERLESCGVDQTKLDLYINGGFNPSTGRLQGLQYSAPAELVRALETNGEFIRLLEDEKILITEMGNKFQSTHHPSL